MSESDFSSLIGLELDDRLNQELEQDGISAPTPVQELAIPAIVFGAVGTAGQRCTSTRRLFLRQHNRRRPQRRPHGGT